MGWGGQGLDQYLSPKNYASQPIVIIELFMRQTKQRLIPWFSLGAGGADGRQQMTVIKGLIGRVRGRAGLGRLKRSMISIAGSQLVTKLVPLGKTAQKRGHDLHRNPLILLVGMRGFEPPTP